MGESRWSRWGRERGSGPGSRARTRWGWGLAAGLGALLAACVSTWPSGGTRFYHRTEAVPQAERIGADECGVCHEDVHGRAPAPSFHADCEACHGGGSLHADSEDPADIRFPSNADCLACHQTGHDTHLAWSTSEHARSGVLCSDCHDVHDRAPHLVRQVKEVAGPAFDHAQGTTRLCVSCHADVAARLDLPSHHPVREGMLACTDCHSPHEDQRVTLGARTARCTQCHQEVAGPWVFEHAPVTEDCGYCHEPHGAVSPDLLATTQPGACLSCHSLPEMGASHDPQAFTSQCTDCHNAIHGSYSDPHLRR